MRSTSHNTRAVVFVSAALLLSAAAQTPNKDSPSKTELTFRVVDAFGRPEQYRVARFYKNRPRQSELASSFHGMTVRNIAVGDYEYVLTPVQSRKFAWVLRPITGRVYVREGDTHVTLYAERDLALDAPVVIDYHDPTVKGRITCLARDSRDVWLRAQPAYSGVARETSVAQDGSFSMSDVMPGNYLVIVYQADRVVYATPVVILQKGVVELGIDICSDGCGGRHEAVVRSR